MKTSKSAWIFAFFATTVTAHPDNNGSAIPFTENIRDTAALLEILNMELGNDKNGVATFLNEHISPPSRDLGYFSFKKFSTQAVFFGEWSNNGTRDDPTREVFYASDNCTLTLPSNQVFYTLEGISNYNGTNLMHGTLIANFDHAYPSFTGSLRNHDLEVGLSGTINNDGSFSGGALAKVPDSLKLLSFGTTQGDFFGAGNTASVVGVARFEDPQYDTAFGGVNFTPASSIQR